MASSTETRTAARNRAQTHFKSSEQRDDAIRAELEKERNAVETKTAKLKALRMAKEAEDKIEADRLAAEAPKKKTSASAAKKPRKAAPKSA